MDKTVAQMSYVVSLPCQSFLGINRVEVLRRLLDSDTVIVISRNSTVLRHSTQNS